MSQKRSFPVGVQFSPGSSRVDHQTKMLCTPEKPTGGCQACDLQFRVAKAPDFSELPGLARFLRLCDSGQMPNVFDIMSALNDISDA